MGGWSIPRLVGVALAVLILSALVPAWNVIANPPPPPPSPANLGSPYGVATDSHGTIYVADSKNHTVLKLSSSGQLVGTWGPAIGKYRLSEVNNPLYLAVNAKDQVLVSAGPLLLKLGPKGTLVPGWQTPKSTYVGWVASDRQNRIFTGGGGAVQVRSRQGKRLSTWSVTRPKQDLTTEGLAVGGKGNVFGLFGGIPSYCNDPNSTSQKGDPACAEPRYFVQKFTTDGKPLLSWHVAFSSVRGLALDRQGNVYVGIAGTDKTLGGIVEYSPSGSLVTGYAIPICTPARSITPGGLAVDKRGVLYESDPYAAVIVRLGPHGQTLGTIGICK